MVCDKLDESMREAFSMFDLLHSSHNYCHVVYTAQQCILGLFQDSDFAGDLRRLKINIGRNLVHVWKSHVRANKLDVQERDFSFSDAKNFSVHCDVVRG